MKNFIPSTILLLLFLIGTLLPSEAVTLPKIFSDNMVLQRDLPIAIWGWAGKGESLIISFNGQKVKAKADAQGNWAVSLKAMSHGGPYSMTVTGKSSQLTFNNILVGDVWVCSGQSNMEWTVANTNNAAQEITEGNYPNLRLFTVQKSVSFQVEKDLQGYEWKQCTAFTLSDFSAVAYFFGRKLVKELGVPIGLINTSWGGTNIQTWISWDVMSRKEPYKNVEIEAYAAASADNKKNYDKFQEAMKSDKGLTEKWFSASTKLSDWKTMKLPTNWEQTSVGEADGIIWFRKDIELPNSQEKNVTLHLGPIDDADETYVNGVKVGATNVWNKDRVYQIPADVLRPGSNTLVVKVIDTGGGGGLYGKQEQLFISIDEQKISLAGDWFYKSSVLTSDFGVKDIGPNGFPSQLFNAMISPITQYGIKGAIWYQGESNTWEGYHYRTLFKEMISNWREKWGYEFPFYWVQLANFTEPVVTPSESDWAELREAQSMALALPQTGQAVIIDLGEANDIHPRNKQDVGYRLALAALGGTYRKNVVSAGPVYESMKVEGNKSILYFTNTGSGLMAKDKYGYVKGFAIAGADKKFVWAKAYISNNTVVVYSEEVTKPVAVRYGWANNPEDVNLYNQEGLPASPFRTDDWKGITQRE